MIAADKQELQSRLKQVNCPFECFAFLMHPEEPPHKRIYHICYQCDI